MGGCGCGCTQARGRTKACPAAARAAALTPRWGTRPTGRAGRTHPQCCAPAVWRGGRQEGGAQQAGPALQGDEPAGRPTAAPPRHLSPAASHQETLDGLVLGHQGGRGLAPHALHLQAGRGGGEGRAVAGRVAEGRAANAGQACMQLSASLLRAHVAAAVLVAVDGVWSREGRRGGRHGGRTQRALLPASGGGRRGPPPPAARPPSAHTPLPGRPCSASTLPCRPAGRCRARCGARWRGPARTPRRSPPSVAPLLGHGGALGWCRGGREAG